MFHIDLTSKRAKLALRFFTYGVMTLATVILTMLAVFYAMGWRFDQNDLTFEQGGLIQFRTTPEGADVMVDGKPQNFTTPGRANLGSGQHTIEMRLSGYRSWQKKVDLAPGQLLWLNYARLVPTTITTTDSASFSDVASAMASPDHRWMLLQEKPDQPSFKLVDFSDEKKPVVTQLNIPDSQLTKKDDKYGQFYIREWDLGSRYILVEHVNGDTHEFIRLDRQKAGDAINVSRVFSLDITEAHFAGSNPNVLYANTANVLRSLDLGSNSASAALIDGVEQFTVYGNDTIAFVASRDKVDGDDSTKQRIVGLYLQGKETVARTYSPTTPISIAYSEYTRHAYLAIETGTGAITLLRDPTTSTKDTAEFAQFSLGKPVQWLKFSSSGRMLVAGNGASVVNYDIELGKTTNWTVPGAAPTQPLQWLDDYYLWTDAGSHLTIVEFDGTNDRTITGVTPGYAASLSPNGTYLYSIVKNQSNKFDLQSSQIIKS